MDVLKEKMKFNHGDCVRLSDDYITWARDRKNNRLPVTWCEANVNLRGTVKIDSLNPSQGSIFVLWDGHDIPEPFDPNSFTNLTKCN